MLLNHSKLIFLMLIFISTLTFSSEKQIKRILSDYTEFDRKTNTTYFYKNVKVELVNGYLLCDKAVYNRPEEKLFCELNVYCVIVSTMDNSKIEVQSLSMKYDILDGIIKFYNNVETIYNNFQQPDEFNFIKLKSDELQFDVSQQTILTTGKVLIETENNRIICSKALYKSKDGLLLLNDGVESGQEVDIVSLTEKYKFKNCKSKTAEINIYKEQILLKGNVEIVF